MMKFSRAISRVKCLSGEKTNVSKTISVLVLRVVIKSMKFLKIVLGLPNTEQYLGNKFPNYFCSFPNFHTDISCRKIVKTNGILKDS
jgi:hypothetical protein